MTAVEADDTDGGAGSDSDGTIELPIRFGRYGQPNRDGGWVAEVGGPDV